MSRHYVITISRQFGTGGREIGKALGAALGVPVYDRELLEEAAQTYCIPVSVMERNDETAPSRVLESFALSAPSLSMLTGAVDYSTIVTSDTTFAWQSATIRRLAKEGPCVIIGRCADHVLRGTPGVVSLFLYADYEARVDHITQKYQLSRGDATILIDETEKERARYYKRHTGQEFARMENYDLCLNTASVNREMAILLLKAFVENQENLRLSSVSFPSSFSHGKRGAACNACRASFYFLMICTMWNIFSAVSHAMPIW